jgi:hypothetical protein
MPNREEQAYFEGLKIIAGYDPAYWRAQWMGMFAHPSGGNVPENARTLARVAFKLFINSQYRNGMLLMEWLPYHQAYRTYRNRLFAPGPGWDEQLTPPGLDELA